MVQSVLKTVGIVARYDNKQALKLVEKLVSYLKDKNLEVYVEETLQGKVNASAESVSLKNLGTDFIITIGGDGTILRTCVNIPKPEPPILAINMGVRGFLTEVEPKNAFAAVDKFFTGDFRIEKSCKLAIKCDDEQIPDALNDVVLSVGEPSKILYTQILKKDKPILKCQADGLILSTQTGSTGYSLSAGGPVLDLDVEAFVLTPICSLTVFRSLVFPADSEVTIKLIRPKRMLVVVDGYYHKLLTENPTVTVTRSKNVTSFIRFDDDFYDRLRNRLLFKGMG